MPAVPKPRRAFRLPHPQSLDALSYARFTGIPTFMRLPHISDPEELEVAIIGVPFDGGTTYRPGPRFGPRNVRVQSAIIRPWNPVLKVNPFAKHRIADFGDLPVNPLSIEDTFLRIEQGIAPLLKAGVRCVCVGGDHSISLPILRAVAKNTVPSPSSSSTLTTICGMSISAASILTARHSAAPSKKASYSMAASCR